MTSNHPSPKTTPPPAHRHPKRTFATHCRHAAPTYANAPSATHAAQPPGQNPAPTTATAQTYPPQPPRHAAQQPANAPDPPHAAAETRQIHSPQPRRQGPPHTRPPSQQPKRAPAAANTPNQPPEPRSLRPRETVRTTPQRHTTKGKTSTPVVHHHFYTTRTHRVNHRRPNLQVSVRFCADERTLKGTRTYRSGSRLAPGAQPARPEHGNAPPQEWRPPEQAIAARRQ